MERGDKILNCPFCDALTITCWVIPSHKEHHTSRGSGQSSGGYHLVSEKATVLSGCSSCGKSKKDVQAKLDGKYKELYKSKCVWCGNSCSEGKIECEECAKV